MNENTTKTMTDAIEAVDAEALSAAVEAKYAGQATSEAEAYRKIASIAGYGQVGGIGAPSELAYWAWKSLNAEGDGEQKAAHAMFAVASSSIGAPVYEADKDALQEIAKKAEAGEDLSDEDEEILADCLRLAYKWIDVAVRTKSNRSGLKGAKVA